MNEKPSPGLSTFRAFVAPLSQRHLAVAGSTTWPVRDRVVMINTLGTFWRKPALILGETRDKLDTWFTHSIHCVTRWLNNHLEWENRRMKDQYCRRLMAAKNQLLGNVPKPIERKPQEFGLEKPEENLWKKHDIRTSVIVLGRTVLQCCTTLILTKSEQKNKWRHDRILRPFERRSLLRLTPFEQQVTSFDNCFLLFLWKTGNSLHELVVCRCVGES